MSFFFLSFLFFFYARRHPPHPPHPSPTNEPSTEMAVIPSNKIGKPVIRIDHCGDGRRYLPQVTDTYNGGKCSPLLGVAAGTPPWKGVAVSHNCGLSGPNTPQPPAFLLPHPLSWGGRPKKK